MTARTKAVSDAGREMDDTDIRDSADPELSEP